MLIVWLLDTSEYSVGRAKPLHFVEFSGKIWTFVKSSIRKTNADDTVYKYRYVEKAK